MGDPIFENATQEASYDTCISSSLSTDKYLKINFYRDAKPRTSGITHYLIHCYTLDSQNLSLLKLNVLHVTDPSEYSQKTKL